MSAHCAGKPLPSLILWIDLETSGLDPERDWLLEIGAVLTNANLDPVSDYWAWRPYVPGLNAVVRNCDTYVREMHEKSGLWQALSDDGNDGPGYVEIEREIIALMARAGATSGPEGKVALAGSGVGRFDSRWLDVHFPMLMRHVEYWALDIGAVRRFLGYSEKGHLCPPSESKVHRAVPDVYAHLGEARMYRALLCDFLPDQIYFDAPDVRAMFEPTPPS